MPIYSPAREDTKILPAGSTNADLSAAVAALPDGGTIALPPGSYTWTDTPVITTNKKYSIIGYGATVALPANKSFLKINQGVSNTLGVVVEGVEVDGQSNAGTTGLIFEDTNWSTIRNTQVKDCATGILMHANTANKFIEGIALEDVVIRGCTTYGIEMRRTDGTNSFAQHHWRNVAINVGGTGVGLKIPSGVSIYRSRFRIGIWISSNQTAWDMDGDALETWMDMFIEGATGSTGNTGILIGSNATNLEDMTCHLSFQGTVNTKISNASSKTMAYHAGRVHYGVTNTAPIIVQQHGDTGASLLLEQISTGGRITFGDGAGNNDTNLYRPAANILATDDTLQFTEVTAPGNGAANTARLYAVDNGAGKTQLVVIFPTGAAQVLATEP